METVFASGLLAGVVFMLFNLYPASALAVRRSQDRLQADQLAQSYLALYQAEPFHTFAKPGALHTFRPPTVQSEGTGTIFTPTIDVMYGPDDTDPRLLRILRVTVDWNWVRGPQSVSHQIYLVDLNN